MLVTNYDKLIEFIAEGHNMVLINSLEQWVSQFQILLSSAQVYIHMQTTPYLFENLKVQKAFMY